MGFVPHSNTNFEFNLNETKVDHMVLMFYDVEVKNVDRGGPFKLYSLF